MLRSALAMRSCTLSHRSGAAPHPYTPYTPISHSVSVDVMGYLGNRQEEHKTLEEALREHAVLGPILQQLQCIIARGGMPNVDCCYGRPEARC
jgi:hypothetical protein